MQNDTISYTQHTGEVVARGVEAAAHGVCSAGTQEDSRADGFVGVQKAARARKNAHVASGRSMIEMLGVLAIIGALSVGGLAALRVAQNKLRANVVVNDVMLAAADLFPRQDVLTAGSVVNTFSFTPKSTLTAQKCADGNIEIMITGVPQKVCQRIAGLEKIKGIVAWGVGGSIFCNNSYLVAEESACVEGNNTMAFVLGAPAETVTCGTETCERGEFCLYSSPSNSSCSSSPNCSNCVGQNPTCTPISGNYAANTFTPNAGGTWVVSVSNNLNYWSAESWCQAQGKTLAGNPFGATGYFLRTSGGGTQGIASDCDNLATNTQYVSGTAGWSSTSWNKSLVREFCSAYEGNVLWLSGSTGDTCSANRATFNSGTVGNGTYRYFSNYAFCQ